MCVCVRVKKYTVQEVSCECEWALLCSGRTYLSCCVMDLTGYLHKVWRLCHLVLTAAFQWWLTVKWAHSVVEPAQLFSLQNSTQNFS